MENKQTKIKKIRVKVYFSDADFKTITEDAEKAGKRRRGLPLFTQKINGFSHEKIANTDGVSKFLKFCWKQFKDSEADRLERLAELKRKEDALLEERKKLGV